MSTSMECLHVWPPLPVCDLQCLPVCDRLLEADVPDRSLCVSLDWECCTHGCTKSCSSFLWHRGLLKPCGGCAIDYLSPEHARKRLLASHDWLLFVGDSDTRGLVLDLLLLGPQRASEIAGPPQNPNDLIFPTLNSQPPF